MMRQVILGTLTLGGLAWAQSAPESAAKGRNVDVPPPPVLQSGPGSSKQTPYNVPPPPPLPRAGRPASSQSSTEPASEIVPASDPAPPRPAPPVMTAAGLATVSLGMLRREVLAMGRNAVRIASTENGRLEETYHYRDGDRPLGVVRIVDGRVVSVDVLP